MLANTWGVNIPYKVIEYNIKNQNQRKNTINTINVSINNLAIIDIEGSYDNPIEVAILITNTVDYKFTSHFHTLIKNYDIKQISDQIKNAKYCHCIDLLKVNKNKDNLITKNN